MTTLPLRFVSLDDTLKALKKELRYTSSIRRARGTAHGYVDVAWTDGPTYARSATATKAIGSTA